ncbi:MAG: non-hydrolyzing UDP-N-acetylglucosamine 2-epimerase [Fimbriimonadaceae bacterium]
MPGRPEPGRAVHAGRQAYDVKLVCVVGTRPEAIKMAPVVAELRRFSSVLQTLLVSTGQHREMLTQALGAFGLTPDVDLAIMEHGQTLAEVTARALSGIDRVVADEKPDFVLAQGDTTTCFCTAVAAFYREVAFGHVEAGLRTNTIDNPFPEEFNRRAVSLITRLHFPPTAWARDNLLREGIDPSHIFVTGNTGIDAVLASAERDSTPWQFKGMRTVVLTTHRRENWGAPQKQIARAARRLLDAHPDIVLVVAMHRNPTVRAVLHAELDHPRAHLIEPPDYGRFVKLLQASTLILTDSGGVQEEAPAFGVPVLVLRTTTERPEGVDAGTAKLVGTEEYAIFTEADRLLGDPNAHSAMAHATSPYGDGEAAARIRFVVLKHLGIESPPTPMWEA